MPADTPVTTPVPDTTVATPVLLLLHVPEGVVLASVVVSVSHTDCVPVMLFGNGSIVTTVVAIQLVPNEYVIVVVPTATPVTMPLLRPIVAAAVFVLVHVPPGIVLESVLVAPIHT